MGPEEYEQPYSHMPSIVHSMGIFPVFSNREGTYATLRRPRIAQNISPAGFYFVEQFSSIVQAVDFAIEIGISSSIYFAKLLTD